MNYEFQPSRKKGRNKFVGSWQETGWKTILLPFTLANLKAVLGDAVGETPKFTHQDVAHWCDQFAMASRLNKLPVDSQAAAEVADDVSAQWDLYLANTYTLIELQKLDFSLIKLPGEWYVDWLQRVNELSRT